MPIRILPPEVASRIAAGEVVERPASVVKELLENAIDAGARDIQIEVEEGGLRLIRVSDDGCGIPAGEVELAFARHATSKLSDVEDLNRIVTLGFRGEALASIAAVSRVEMSTRSADEEVGTQLSLEAGEIVRRRPVGRPPGTSITVENLFFNVPARRKFLRSPLTEAGHIQEIVTYYAMAYPARRISLTHNGRPIFRSPGTGNLLDVLLEIHGPETAGALLPIQTTAEEPSPVMVSGYVSPPALHRADRRHMVFFVNGRWVRDKALAYAVLQAYHTLLPANRFPIAVVQIHLDPAEVDVNVHPTKTEVRFRAAGEVFRAVQRQVRAALVQQAPAAPQFHVPGWGERPSPSAEIVARQQMLMSAGRGAVEHALRLIPPAEEPAPEPAGTPPSRLPILRVVGQVRQMYIIAEGPDGLYLIDQHAAHERVLYEQMLSQATAGVPLSQALLEPQVVPVDLRQQDVIRTYDEELRWAGFELEPFGEGAFLLRAVPAVLAGRQDPRTALYEVLEELERGETPLARRKDAAVMAAVCKRGAVKAGQTLSHEEMTELVRRLEATSSPQTCPHGRPTMIHLSAEALARQFLRS
jgi:DNA mismatch repair protein MutL